MPSVSRLTAAPWTRLVLDSVECRQTAGRALSVASRARAARCVNPAGEGVFVQCQCPDTTSIAAGPRPVAPFYSCSSRPTAWCSSPARCPPIRRRPTRRCPRDRGADAAGDREPRRSCWAEWVIGLEHVDDGADLPHAVRAGLCSAQCACGRAFWRPGKAAGADDGGGHGAGGGGAGRD